MLDSLYVLVLYIHVIVFMPNSHIVLKPDCDSFVCGTGVLDKRQPLPTSCACDFAASIVNATRSLWLRGHSMLQSAASYLSECRLSWCRAGPSHDTPVPVTFHVCVATMTHRLLPSTTPEKSHIEKWRADPVQPVIYPYPSVVRALTRKR